MPVQNPAGVEVFYVEPTEPARPNRMVNWTVYKTLTRALSTTGWDGPPVVVLFRDDYDPPAPPLALTGSHRLAAAEAAGIDVPCVGLAALFAKRGLDLDDFLDEWIPEGASYSDRAQLQAIAQVLHRMVDRLPIWMFTSYDISLEFCPGTALAGDGHRHLCNVETEHELDGDPHECEVCGAEYDATPL